MIYYDWPFFSKPTAAVAYIGTERADGEQAGAAAHSVLRLECSGWYVAEQNRLTAAAVLVLPNCRD